MSHFTVYNYCCIGPTYIPEEAIAILSKRVSQINEQGRFMVDDDTWPPEQLKSFTSLLLVCYEGHRSSEQVTAIAKLMHSGEITSLTTTDITHHPKLDSCNTLQEVLNATTVTTKMEEILAPLENGNPCLILIEGAPGIGKSVLLKEIAYQWSKKHLLKIFKVVLLICLRDPILQQVESVPDLLQYFCKGDPDAKEIVAACSKYLFKNGGKDLVFLFDGYDELPEKLQTDSLIVDILKRRLLPYCGLVVSSRPHATKQLHKQATLRVDILGFTEEERQHHIQRALHNQPHKIKEITWYLEHHLTIGSLCYLPFNLVVLLYLYKHGVALPKNSAELYNYFICLTICRHAAKHGHHLQNNAIQLNNLPEPYDKIVQQLSKFSLEALNHDKLIFTLDEIKAGCPDITTIPGAINGFGLLQAVEHFGLTGATTTFNFLHFSIQEYLAAYYITKLSAAEELRIIEEKFWSDIHFNMFSIYITLTKGQRPSFKHFLSGGNKAVAICDKFLRNQLQCLRLYHCFHEANNLNICNIIEQSVSFNDNKIDLRYTTLTTSDVQCVTVFLTSSFHKEWVTIDFYSCYIQDHGLQILYRGLQHRSDVTIRWLWLSYNGLTTQSSTVISEITVNCKVKVLGIAGNQTIGEDQQLYTMLTDPSSVLEELYMYYTGLSSRGAIALFRALEDNNNLKALYNAITDDACDAITTALEKNNCLVKLFMYNNPLSSKGIVSIVKGLILNNTLTLLRLPTACPEATKKRINFLQDDINEKRLDRGCQEKLMIIYW